MKIDLVFVDAENVGGNVIKTIPTYHGRFVFIFSKLLKIAELSNHLGFTCINNYPKGNNQADFSIIGLLGKKIAEYDYLPNQYLHFILYTHDKNLIEAFKNLCKVSGVKAKIISPNPNPTSHKNISPKVRVLRALKTPQKLNEELWGRLQLTQAEFSRTVTELIRTGMIFRSTQRKKYWVARSDEIDRRSLGAS